MSDSCLRVGMRTTPRVWTDGYRHRRPTAQFVEWRFMFLLISSDVQKVVAWFAGAAAKR